VVGVGLVLLGSALAHPAGSQERPAERGVHPIALDGVLATPEVELSGLAWHGDQLVLLPQYPARHGDVLFALRRHRVEAYLDGDRDRPLHARPVPLVAPGLAEGVEGFEGFEAIAFAGRDAYLAVEATARDRTTGWLVRGRVEDDLARVIVDVEGRVPLRPQTRIENLGYEALVVGPSGVTALYEANGAVNSDPVALAFDRTLDGHAERRMDRLEYRLTDATRADAAGRFWVTNYLWPGTEWTVGVCPLTRRWGRGASHARAPSVERLVELHLREDRVALTDTPPVQLALEHGGRSRNWEGIARLGSRGLLLVTDEHPRSMLAFVARAAEGARGLTAPRPAGARASD